ncbi:MAG: hypothetical protein JO103_14985 [Candidatus Eremiobacteraeota bacterium]|nr:hypothetical protein [Candidatus Eremiobacteraeota bacterium]
MARVCSVIAMSHSPFLFASADEWSRARAARAANGSYDASVPVDDDAANAAKHARCMHALAVLAERLRAAKPDVLVVFGDDQREQFDFGNFPAFGIYLGERFAGYKISRYPGLPSGAPRPTRARTPEHWAEVHGHPALARALLVGLMRDGFDLAFSLQLSNEEEGMGHAFMRPSYFLDPDYALPVVPLFVNCYFGPQPTARRCAALGRAVRAAIEASPLDLNVAVIGSGGLWHTPNAPRASLDESFDRAILDHVVSGDADAMAAVFDGALPAYEPADPESVRVASGGTGIVFGHGGGTGETRNWVAAAAVAGRPGTVVDYVPVYASPVGAAFAHWEFA